MSRTQPYQPLLLRLLHGVNGSLILGAALTGALLYDRYDGRFGKIPLPPFPASVDVHGTLGLMLLIVFPFFAFYSFYIGSQRLVQADTGTRLMQLGKPLWWYTLHRVLNTLMLLAVTVALVTGRQMKENWLGDGNLTEIAYILHLSSWVLVVSGLLLHTLMALKVGGVPLLLSMGSLSYRSTDLRWPWHNLTRRKS